MLPSPQVRPAGGLSPSFLSRVWQASCTIYPSTCTSKCSCELGNNPGASHALDLPSSSHCSPVSGVSFWYHMYGSAIGTLSLVVGTSRVAKVLKGEGYIVDYDGSDNPSSPVKLLKIDMKYSPDRHRVISGIRRVSKPGLRVYRKHNEVERVLGGLGVAVLSTSKGLMTDREARRQRVGGEVLCHVW